MTISNTVIIPDEVNRKLREYARLIYEHNKTTNITGLKDSESIYNELILGSITPLKHVNVPRGTSFIDIGTGAGIPGIPLLLYFGGNIKGVLVDSNNKKIKFLLNAINTLGINDIVTVIQGRVEEIAKEKAYRDSFDFAVSRAFAHPLMALEYGLPFVKPGGWLYIYYNVHIPDSTCNPDLLGDCAYRLQASLKKHSQNIGGYFASVDEALKLGIREGFLFIKESITPQKYPRKHAVVIRDVERCRSEYER